MSSETKLPWPGYRLRDGWMLVNVGWSLNGGDICRNENGEWMETQREGQSALSCDEPYFRRTRPDAEMPPVEPIPVEPGDDVRKSLEIVSDALDELRRERDELRKQVAALKEHFQRLTKQRDESDAERDELKKQVETLTAEADGIRRLLKDSGAAGHEMRRTIRSLEANVAELKTDLGRANQHIAAGMVAESLSTKPARDWRAELRPCWFAGRDDSGLFHGWMRNFDDSIVAIVELPTGLVDRWSVQDVRFTKPKNLKEPQS